MKYRQFVFILFICFPLVISCQNIRSGIFANKDACDFLFVSITEDIYIEEDTGDDDVTKFKRAYGWRDGNDVEIEHAFGVNISNGKKLLMRYFKTPSILMVLLEGGKYRTYKRINNHSTIESSDSWLEYVCNSKSAFPYRPYGDDGFHSGKIQGKAWRFQYIDIKLNWNGLITADGYQSTNSCEGFTGRIYIDLIDHSDNTMARIPMKRQGIGSNFANLFNNCYNDREYNSTYQLNLKKYPYLLTELKKINAFAVRESSNKDVFYYTNALKKISSDLSTTGKNVAALSTALGEI